MIKKDVLKRIIQVILTLLFQGVLLFLSAWSLNWIWAWVFISTGIIVLVINSIVLPEEVIEERGRKKENVKKWDKILTAINIIPIVGMYILAGLDYRFKWSISLPVSIYIMGLVLFFSGAMLFTWAMASNKYFSTLVRIQKERGHKVAAGGPYKYIRHPGYIGFILMSLATPLTLGSLYALSMSFITGVIFAIRTILEDKTLKVELKGYKEYSKKVKYKLLPFIW